MAEEVNGQAEGIDFTADNVAEDFSFDPVPTQSASSTTASEMENGPPADPSASDEAAAEGANPDAAASNGAETIAEAKDGEPKAEGGEGSEVGAAPVTYGASAETPAAPAFDDSKLADDERYKSLRAQNLDPRVAACLIALFDAEVLTPEDVDERAIEMLRMFRLDHAQHVLGGLLTANLIGVQNKASFLMALMRNFRDRLRQLGIDGPLCCQVLVANLPYNVQSGKIYEVFGVAGKVVMVDLQLDKEGKSKGLSVVEYTHPIEAVQAVSMLNNQRLYDRSITVKMDKYEKQAELRRPGELPVGLKGVGMGLGTNGQPLTHVDQPINGLPVAQPAPQPLMGGAGGPGKMGNILSAAGLGAAGEEAGAVSMEVFSSDKGDLPYCVISPVRGEKRNGREQYFLL